MFIILKVIHSFLFCLVIHTSVYIILLFLLKMKSHVSHKPVTWIVLVVLIFCQEVTCKSLIALHKANNHRKSRTRVVVNCPTLLWNYKICDFWKVSHREPLNTLDFICVYVCLCVCVCVCLCDLVCVCVCETVEMNRFKPFPFSSKWALFF